MSILSFQRPDKVIMINSDDKKGTFEFRPLEPLYGNTIGNALRRVLLSSLEGFAITSMRIQGVAHEFMTIKGVLEDVTNIVLNVKQIRLKQQITGMNTEKVKVLISDQEVFTAGDLNKFLEGFQVLNPDLVICNMEKNVVLNIEFEINKGRGYVPSEDNKVEAHLDTIFLDSIHTPIKKVQYTVENYRVAQKTDYEKLILEIETDGSITPKYALKEAATILIQHFMLFSDDKINVDIEEKPSLEPVNQFENQMARLLRMKLTDMDISVRAQNCLKQSEIETVGDLVSMTKSDLLKIRSLGKKSLTELEDLVRNKNLEFGMDVEKYSL